MPTTAAPSEPRAALQGEMEKPVRTEIERAIGAAKGAPGSRVDARRRAREAAQAAIAVLRSEGYYDYQVEPAIGEGDTPAAIVRVTAGPRTLLGPTTVVWNGAPPDAASTTAAVKTLDLAPGAPARAGAVIAAEGRVVAVLRERGYADAAIRPRRVVVDHAGHLMQPTLEFAAGPLARLDGVKVVGRTRLHRRWVTRLKAWRTNDVYSPARVAKLDQRLRDTGVFRSVSVSLAPADQAVSGERPVLVDVTDRAPHTIELGGGYSTSEGAGIEARWLTYNRLGLADTLTLTGRLAQIQQKLDAELDVPDWIGLDQVVKVGADIFGDDTPAYDDAGLGFRADVVHNYTRTTSTTLGVSAEAVDTSEKEHINPNGLGIGANLKLAVFSTTGAFTLDKSNDPLNPTRGWRLTAEADPTYVAGDRNLPFLKLVAQATAYQGFGIDDSTVLAGRVRMGSILGGGDVLQIPDDLRFYAGGGGSVRGFNYQGVGPELANGEPLGGVSLFESSLEVRQHVTGPWGLVGFVDAGSVGPTYAPDFNLLQVGAGLGVRYNLGFGPLRFDIATPVTRRKGDPWGQVYLSIGQSF